MNDSSVGIRAVKATRSELFLLKKGCRQASLVQGGSQRTNTGSNKVLFGVLLQSSEQRPQREREQ
ncbi:hypothetical protein KFX41_16195 [Bacteroides thetaiotaomicron]|uniref:hypothetical protein n=1 Tax=Bacteroides thetaiotaomicron TaxID=818 RepID=UPI001CE2A0E1|nr:hypothetical protein [Bacteroides thetaiotaomicron]MCA5987190.1 hypothetical protein [Bacteroides thetaiotaomicron]MCA6040746.1 hypothetical protein [Bacteroides thetaiotaomicron]